MPSDLNTPPLRRITLRRGTMTLSTAETDLEILTLTKASTEDIGPRNTNGNRRQPASCRDQDCVRRRLFLLAHASSCTDSHKCAHVGCAQTKDLLKHTTSCRDGSCPVAHCRSGRVLMDHLRACDDAACCLCSPVHEALGDEYWGGTRRDLSSALCAEHFCATKRKLAF